MVLRLAGRNASIGGAYWLYACLIFQSFAGSIGHVIAATWLLLQGPNGATYVSAAFMISAVPSMLLYRVIRSRAWKFDLTRSLAFLDLLQALLAGSLPLLHGIGMDIPRGLVLGQEFLLSCCGTFVFPLSRMLLVRVVAPGAELRANSTSAAVFQAGNSIGAIQGGLTVAAFGPYLAMTTNALTFLVSAASLMWLVKPYPLQEAMTADQDRDTALTLPVSAPIGTSALIVGTVALLTVQRYFLGSVGVLVKTHLDGTATLQGMLQLAFALGGITGGLAIGQLSSRVSSRTLILPSLGASLAAFLALGTFSTAITSLTASFILGNSVSLWSIFQTRAQLMVDSTGEGEILARIGFGQSAAALAIFAVSTLATFILRPQFTFMFLGCSLVAIVLAATRKLPVALDHGA